MDNGFKFVEKNGITTEDKYAYTARDQKCKVKGGDFKITGHKDVAAGDAN